MIDAINHTEILLPMAGAYAQWQEGNENDFWIAFDKSGKRLGELPARLDEREVMKTLRLSRKYELDAFNQGIDFGKTTAMRSAKHAVDQAHMKCRDLEKENERLASQLLRHISGDSN